VSGFNLSEWAIRHRSLVTYFMLVIVIAGVGSYLRLGRSEDPAFTIKTMIALRQGEPSLLISAISNGVVGLERIKAQRQCSHSLARDHARPAS